MPGRHEQEGALPGDRGHMQVPPLLPQPWRRRHITAEHCDSVRQGGNATGVVQCTTHGRVRDVECHPIVHSGRPLLRIGLGRGLVKASEGANRLHRDHQAAASQGCRALSRLICTADNDSGSEDDGGATGQGGHVYELTIRYLA